MLLKHAAKIVSGITSGDCEVNRELKLTYILGAVARMSSKHNQGTFINYLTLSKTCPRGNENVIRRDSAVIERARAVKTVMLRASCTKDG